MELHVILAAIPDVAAWQRAITAAGFNIVLDSALNTTDHVGFVPVRFAGIDSGFEYDIFPIADITEAYPSYASQFGNRRFSANFRWGGDLTEMSCVLAASAALAKLTNGICFDPQEGVCLTGDQAIAQAKAEIAAANPPTK